MSDGGYRLDALRDCMRMLLEAERQRIQAEIRSYPTPIPRCDQQFNLLIARREQLAQELARLDATLTQAPTGAGPASLDAFIAASPCLDDEAKLRLRAALRATPLDPPIAAARAPRGQDRA